MKAQISSNVFCHAAIGIDLEACCFEGVHGFRLAIKQRAPVAQQDVSEKIETALRGDAWFELADRPGRCVARVGELRQALLLTLVVHSFERRQGHQQFAAHFKISREPALFQALGGYP